jgi:hypothetical protein
MNTDITKENNVDQQPPHNVDDDIGDGKKGEEDELDANPPKEQPNEDQ